MNFASRLAADGIEVALEAGRPVAIPEDAAALAGLVERAAADGARLVPVGLGGKLPWLRPDVLAYDPEAALLVSTRKLDQVVSYVPGDGTLTAQAGAPMELLARTVAEGGHRLTPDVALPAASTLGGVVAGSVSGLDRLQRGPVRHHVLGARAVQADGSEARSGGRLVKNVTGYDLHRLWTGSRGTLGVLTEISLRLFPAPELELCLEARFDSPALALGAAHALRDLPLAPVALRVEGDGDAGAQLHLFLAGLERQVRADAERSAAALSSSSAAAPTLLEGAAARETWARLRDADGGGQACLRLTCLPSRAADALATAETYFRARGARLHARSQPWIASLDLELLPEADGAAGAAARVDVDCALDLAERLAPAEVRVTPLATSLEVHSALASGATTSRAQVWMRALRSELDPAGTFASSLYPYPTREPLPA